MRSFADVKQEWHHFRDDPPGERFRNHRDRMKQRSRTHAAAAIALGVLFLMVGVVLLFIPGPGLLFIVFGLALIASHSKRLSDVLDRTEPKLRRAGHRTKAHWQALPGRAKFGVIIALAMLAVAASLTMWEVVVSGYVRG
jgi:uncharacterized membrane protein YbaN (DUF454 family)